MTETPPVDDLLTIATAFIEAGKSVRLSGGARSGKSRLLSSLAQNLHGVLHLDADLSSARAFGAEPIWHFMSGRRFHRPGPFRLDLLTEAVLRATRIIIIDNSSQMRVDELQRLRDALFACPTGYGPFAGRQLVLGHDPDGLPAPMHDRLADDIRRVYGGTDIEISRFFQDMEEHALTPSHHAAPGTLTDPVASEDLPEGEVLVTSDWPSAHAINDLRMEALPGGVFRIQAEMEGSVPASASAMPGTLILKRHARVLMTEDGPGESWLSGDTGQLQACERDAGGNPVAIVTLTDGREVRIGQSRCSFVRHETERPPGGRRTLVRRETGSMRQLPLLPGWAIPVWCLNGKSLARPVPDASLDRTVLHRALASRMRACLDPSSRKDQLVDAVPAE